MTCCFMNFQRQETESDLAKHFDREIDIAIGRGCDIFICGNKYPEDEIFAKRVMNMAKYYAEGEISLVRMENEDDMALKKRFISLADWEIYAYDCDRYPLSEK